MQVQWKNVKPGSKVKIYGQESIYQGAVIHNGLMYFRNGLPVGAEQDRPIKYPTPEDLVEVVNDAVKQPIAGLPYTAGLTTGSDPELFVTDKDGNVIPAGEFLRDEETEKADNTYGMVHAYWDGIQAEFGPPATTCLEGQCQYMHLGLKRVLQAAQLKSPGAKLSLNSVIRLKKMKDIKPEWLAFRCTPSYNIYGDVSETPDAMEYPFRCTGGHIHSGLGSPVEIPAPVLGEVVKALDAISGIAGVSLAANWDNPERRRYYGRAGDFRLPKHGLEYRVHSNFWLCHPAMMHLMLDWHRLAFSFGMRGFRYLWKSRDEEVQEIINNCDVKGARKILTQNAAIAAELVQRMSSRRYTAALKTSTHDKIVVDTLMNGMEVLVKDPQDISGNWHLEDGRWTEYGRGKDGNLSGRLLTLASSATV